LSLLVELDPPQTDTGARPQVSAQDWGCKVAYLSKDYPSALQHLQAALVIWPEMIEAHQTLSGTYRALGEKDKAIEELRTVLRIKQQNPTAD